MTCVLEVCEEWQVLLAWPQNSTACSILKIFAFLSRYAVTGVKEHAEFRAWFTCLLHCMSDDTQWNPSNYFVKLLRYCVSWLRSRALAVLQRNCAACTVILGLARSFLYFFSRIWCRRTPSWPTVLVLLVELVGEWALHFWELSQDRFFWIERDEWTCTCVIDIWTCLCVCNRNAPRSRKTKGPLSTGGTEGERRVDNAPRQSSKALSLYVSTQVI